MKENLIGMFDSGLGGLSVLRALIAGIPNVPALFVADQQHCPYGKLTEQAILNRSITVCDWLVSQEVTQIVVACNTATSVAIEQLRQRYTIPVIGIEPAVKPAAAQTHTGKIAILATAATLRTERYHQLTDRYGKSVTVYAVTPEGWVDAVEGNTTDVQKLYTGVNQVIQPLLDAGVDQIVLGCTHYPFLRFIIEQIVPPGVTLHDPAPAVISHAASLMNNLPRTTERNGGNYRFYTTGSPVRMKESLNKLLGIKAEVESISV
ncbi:glutamate racemase [Salmonella enterica]|nr:glutamate racemase [Salmonella enterica subsp. salamae]ECL1288129.1 glutamate racemase [Salmonella enterica]ECJ2729149.1 glutamate racemase [Salmonella enterica subsp. salamae]EEA0957369.1 glutamate racemase [Salmonella enterica]EGH5308843.1 glutamate racemase [Salmonella enterica]